MPDLLGKGGGGGCRVLGLFFWGLGQGLGYLGFRVEGFGFRV